jgi:hypothetical protein
MSEPKNSFFIDIFLTIQVFLLMTIVIRSKSNSPSVWILYVMTKHWNWSTRAFFCQSAFFLYNVPSQWRHYIISLGKKGIGKLTKDVSLCVVYCTLLYTPCYTIPQMIHHAEVHPAPPPTPPKPCPSAQKSVKQALKALHRLNEKHQQLPHGKERSWRK